MNTKVPQMNGLLSTQCKLYQIANYFYKNSDSTDVQNNFWLKKFYQITASIVLNLRAVVRSKYTSERES